MPEPVVPRVALNSPRVGRPVVVALALVTVGYLLQLESPLRMRLDSIGYLAMADSAVAGTGFLHDGVVRQFPIGYPLVLATLIRLGLSNSTWFIGWNLATLALGVLATFHIVRRAYDLDRHQAAVICLLTLSSYLVIHYSIPLMSETTYFAVSSGCLLALVNAHREVGRRRFAWLGVAVVTAILSIEVRTIGITLLAAVGWVVISGEPFRSLASSPDPRRRRLFLVGLAAGTLVVGIVGFLGISRTWYFETIAMAYNDLGGGFGVVLELLERLAREQGRIWVNLPVALVLPVIGQKISLVVYGLLGGVAAVVAALGFFARRLGLGPTDAYVAAVAGMLFFNPFDMERHWLPVVPFLLCLARAAVMDLLRPERARAVLVGFSIWYVATGFVGMAFSTQVSFSGREFPRYFLHNAATYRAAFSSDLPFDPMEVRLDLLRLLRRYEPLATDDYVPDPGNLPPPPHIAGPNSPRIKMR